ncbi:MAG: alpha/beta hydrolase [Saprospiraceae bacterium]|nr:alpha/beta hydrolase [Saprospiraceae bacterium]
MKQRIDANSRKVAFLTDSLNQGDIPLLLLHGFCEDSGIWTPLLPYLEGLPLLRIDLPGFGDSDLPPSAGMSAYADAVHCVLDALHIDRAVLVGHSMGGYAALAFAEAYPERLSGFGLFHSHPYADTPERKEGRQRGMALVEEGRRDAYVAQLFPGLFAPDFAAAHPEVVLHLVETQGRRQSPEAIITALKAMMNRPDHTETLRRFARPVLWLLGEKDALVPVVPTLEAAALCPLGVVHLMTDAGHMGMYESPEACAEMLRAFYILCTRP